MAPRRSIGEAQLAFDALSIEGGLLGAEWLGKVAQLEATAQEPADYRVPKGLQLRDEIARSWRIAQACWKELEAGRVSGGDARALAELVSAGWTLQGNRFVKGDEVMLPLYEAKMVHHFDHRYGDYADQRAGSENTSLPDVPLARLQDPAYQPLPRYWLPRAEVEERLAGRWDRGWLLGWRDITGTEKIRTVIASLIPRAAVGDTFLLMMPSAAPPLVACLYACLTSFVLDYAARQKVGGTHLKFHPMKQLPVLSPAAYLADAPWHHGRTLRDWILPRVLELTYTAWDLEPFARDCGDDGPLYLWDPERRVHLRAEFDAAFFHLYGLSRDEAAYVMDTFPIVKKHDEAEHGEYRTKRVILETYDALASAAASGKPYVSPLGPPRRARAR